MERGKSLSSQDSLYTGAKAPYLQRKSDLANYYTTGEAKLTL